MNFSMKLVVFIIFIQICLSSLNNHKFRENHKTKSSLAQIRKLSLYECSKNSKISSLADSLKEFIGFHPKHTKEAVKIFSYLLYQYQSSCLSNHQVYQAYNFAILKEIKHHLTTSTNSTNATNTTYYNATLLSIAISILDVYIESGLVSKNLTNATTNVNITDILTPLNAENATKAQNNSLVVFTINNVTFVIEVLNETNSTYVVDKNGTINFSSDALASFVLSVLESSKEIQEAGLSLIIDVASVIMDGGALGFILVAAVFPILSDISELSSISFLELWDSMEDGFEEAAELDINDTDESPEDVSDWILNEIKTLFLH